jgi:hypothetical protein
MEPHNAPKEREKGNPTKEDTGIEVPLQKEKEKGKVEVVKAKGRDAVVAHLSTANVGIAERPDTWQGIVIAGKQETKHSNKINRRYPKLPTKQPSNSPNLPYIPIRTHHQITTWIATPHQKKITTQIVMMTYKVKVKTKFVTWIFNQ